MLFTAAPRALKQGVALVDKFSRFVLTYFFFLELFLRGQTFLPLFLPRETVTLARPFLHEPLSLRVLRGPFDFRLLGLQRVPCLRTPYLFLYEKALRGPRPAGHGLRIRSASDLRLLLLLRPLGPYDRYTLGMVFY